MLHPATDPDLGWHLRTGQLILSTHTIPTVDPYSFTKLGAPWVEHEWLWQVAIAAADRVAGVLGVVILNSLSVVVAVAFVYLRLRTRDVAPQFAAVGAAGSLVVLGAFSDGRPAMVVLPFAGFFLLAFERYERSHNWRWLAAVLPVGLMWANAHGSYILGVLLCGVYGVAHVWESRSLKGARPWALLAAGLLAISMINPHGLDLLRFTFGASRLPFNREYINEWMAPDFRLWSSASMLAAVVVSLGTALLCRPLRSKTQILLLCGCTLAVLQSQQFWLLYAVAAVPVLAEMVERSVSWRPAAELSSLSVLALGAAAVLMACAFPLRALQPPAYEAAVAKTYPAQAVAFIEREQLQGPMWDEFDWGGYLIGALPRLPVFVDGRTELYGNAFMFEYSRVALAQAPPDPALDAYGIKLVLIVRDSPLAVELRQKSGWREVYQDDIASVFIR